MEQNLSIRSGNGEAIYQVNGSKCTLKARWNKGKKEGPATLYDSRHFVFAELVFVNDQINGTCLLRNDRGRLIFRGSIVNGKKEGLCHEYDDTGTRVFYGFYHDGEKHPLMTPNPDLPGFYDERSIEGELLSISEYNETHEYKNGHCYVLENGVLIQECDMEKGIQKRMLREWKDNWMIEYFVNGNVEYEGQWKGDVVGGFIREGEGVLYDQKGKVKYRGPFEQGQQFYQYEDLKNMPGFRRETTIHGNVLSVSEYDSSRRKHGRCFLYQNDVVNEECVYSRGKKRETIRLLDGTTMKVFRNSQLVYQGTYSGDMKTGYKRAGQGTEYENGSVVYVGDYMDDKRNGMGTQYRNEHEWFIGSFKKGVQHGQGRIMNEDGTVIIEGDWKYGFLQTEYGFVDAETGITESPFAPGFMHRWKERGGAAESGQIAVAIVKDAIRRIHRGWKKWIHDHFGLLLAIVISLICIAGDILFPILLEWHVVFIILCILAGIAVLIVTCIFLMERLNSKGGWRYGFVPLGIHLILVAIGFVLYYIILFFIWLFSKPVRWIVALSIVTLIVIIVLVIRYRKPIIDFFKHFKERIHQHFGTLFLLFTGIICLIADILVSIFVTLDNIAVVVSGLFGCAFIILPICFLYKKLDEKGGWKYGLIPIGAHLALIGLCCIVYFFLQSLLWVLQNDGRIITVTSLLGVGGFCAFLMTKKPFLLWEYVISYLCFLLDVILPIVFHLSGTWKTVWCISGLVIGIGSMIWIVKKKHNNWPVLFISLDLHCIEEGLIQVYFMILFLIQAENRVDLKVILCLLIIFLVPSFFETFSCGREDIMNFYPYYVLILSFVVLDSVLTLFFNGSYVLCGVFIILVFLSAWFTSNSTDWEGFKSQFICQLILSLFLLLCFALGNFFYSITTVSVWCIVLIVIEVVTMMLLRSHPTACFVVTCITIISLFVISLTCSIIFHLPAFLIVIICLVSFFFCAYFFKWAYSGDNSVVGIIAVAAHCAFYIILYIMNLFYQFYNVTKLPLVYVAISAVVIDIIMALFYYMNIGNYIMRVSFVVVSSCVIPISHNYSAGYYVGFILVGLVYFILPTLYFKDHINRFHFFFLGIQLAWFFLIGFVYNLFWYMYYRAVLPSSISAVVTMGLLLLWLYEMKQIPVIKIDEIETKQFYVCSI